MKYEITGKIIIIGETKNVSSNFDKRTFVIETDEGQYSQTVEIELFKHGVSLINNFALGDMVKVDFNIRGRSWKNPEGVVKYFISLQAWRIGATNGADPIDTAIPEHPSSDRVGEGQDSLPF